MDTLRLHENHDSCSHFPPDGFHRPFQLLPVSAAEPIRVEIGKDVDWKVFF